MDAEAHALALGKLLGNLHALEMALRAYLINRPEARPVHAQHGVDFSVLSVGTELPESDLTSHLYLSELVKSFNRLALEDGTPAIDERVVTLRNTLVHGCVVGNASSFPVRIVKFSRPHDGKVKIETSQEMTSEWFDSQLRELWNAISTIAIKMQARIEA